MGLQPFLQEDAYVDFSAGNIREFLEQFRRAGESGTDLARRIYQFVRDEVPHSFDVRVDVVTARASAVLEHRTGICHAKANLLAALLRACGIPAGFRFQRITLADDDRDGYCVHCFNAVYLDAHWIQLDARGNTGAIDAQFSLSQPKLAFASRPQFDEYTWPGIYARPHRETMEMLERVSSVQEIYERIPDCVDAQPDFLYPEFV